MADIIEDIKARLSIVDLVSQYVQMKKTGRNFKGLCPFHSEKTPSFIVSPEKQICHCFGCNKGGDIFGFMMELEGITFPEAIQILADRAGVKIENFSKYRKGEAKGEKDEYFKANDLACAFFEKQLHHTEAGKKVLEYLYKRGLKLSTIEEFRLGFAPDSYDALYPELLKKINKKVLIKSGLVSAKSFADDQIYDKFRDRLMFPIFDYFGRISGFGGRTMNDEQQPKYLNSPENPVYEKGKLLYGFFFSKQFVKEADKIVLVEGYFDVILPYQEGIKNIVASSGTALTRDQVRLIKRITPNVITCFDTDDAGFEATKRAYFILREEGMNVRTIEELGVKDPADFVLERKDLFKEFVEKAPDYVSFYINKLISRYDMTNFEGRNKILTELLPVYKTLSSVSKDFYVRELAQKLKLSEKSLYDEIDKFKLPLDHPARTTENNPAASEKKISYEEIFLAIILNQPNMYKSVFNLINENFFEGQAQDIYKVLTEQYNASRANFLNWNFEKDFSPELKAKVDILLLYAEEAYGQFPGEIVTAELKKLVDKMKKNRKMSRLKTLQMQIAEAEEKQEKDNLILLLKEQQEIISS